jgi:hypothetical protein
LGDKIKKDVDWLEWEDPFCFHDTLEFKSERENGVMEAERLACHPNLRALLGTAR